MKLIKNIDQHDIKMPFEGYTYYLQKDVALAVPDNLFAFLEESFPLTYLFDQAILKAEKVREVKKNKSKIHSPLGQQPIDADTEDMVISSPKPKDSFGFNDEIPTTPDWYGNGLEVDNGG